MSETNARIYNFKYKQDSDYYAEEYRKKFNEGYGDRIYDNELEFAKDSQNVEVIFSSSVITEFPVDDKIYPSILKVTNDVEERISHNIRIMQVAVIPNTLGLIYDNVTSPTNLYSMNRYCYSGHLDNPRVPTADINWGSPQEVKFNLTAGSLSNNLFNAFYSPYMAEITDKDSRLVTCEMYLNEIDIFRLDFSKFKMIDGVLYRLSKVIDWSSPSTCKVDLLRVINTTYTNEAHYFRTANLCDRVWSCENLNVKNFKNGDAIRFITNQSDWDYYSGNLYEPCCAYPDFDEANASYGLLYNWFAVNDSRGLAEEGWRVSTDEDWEKLQDCIANTNNLKEVGGFHWDYLNGTDAYGFTALGSGNIQGDGSFQDFRQYAHFWTSISVSADEAKYQRIFGNSGTYDLRDGNKKQGKSIRLVKI
jgi:uncharacterized protein (TIGR02145 family)